MIGKFKYLLLYCYTSSYAFDLVLCLWNPVALFPIRAFVSNGLLPKLNGYVQFFVFGITTIHYTQALTMAVMYRYAQVRYRMCYTDDTAFC